jgi:AcrR family transcriptional regulator
MSEAATIGVPLVGDPLSPGLPPAFERPQVLGATKVRLILAAEALFSEQSIESVSLREIARAAGNGNNNAVQYHFGGKKGLVQAIFAYRVWQMDKARREGLERLRSIARDVDIQDLLELLFLPLLDLTDATGRHTYASFIVKYLLLSRPAGLPHAMDSLTESTAALRQINSRIERQLAHLPADLVSDRIATASLMFNAMLVRSDNDGVTKTGGAKLRQRVDDCLEMAAAALLAPARAQS